jgi:glycosyltransferase involved in cell wall biosynthesis
MKISVVIPVYNAAGTIEQCLASIYEQSRKPFEIIAVDNHSRDGSKELIRRYFNRHEGPPSRCLEEHRQGPSFARNRGAFQAQGDIIAFIDADCIADPSWLERLSESFSEPDVGAVAGRIAGYDRDSPIGKFHALFTMKELPQSQLFHEFNLLSGGFPTANFSIRRDVFISLKGFDEAIPIYAEDYDLCARIYGLGLSVFYNREVKVLHQHRQTLLSTWRQSYGFGTGHATLLKKHFTDLFILEMPRSHLLFRQWPFRAWIDLASADKKLFGSLVLSALWWPFGLILVFFLLFLFRDIQSRLEKDGLSGSVFEIGEMVFLLFAKSAALTAGRWAGSLKQGVLCL